jgi:hypothetical protein
MEQGSANRREGLSVLVERRFKVYDPEGAKRLLGVIKDSILRETSTAISVYANLKKSGKHIIWVPEK